MAIVISLLFPILSTSSRCSLAYPRHALTIIIGAEFECLPPSNIIHRSFMSKTLKPRPIKYASDTSPWPLLRDPVCYETTLIPFLSKETSCTLANTLFKTVTSTKYSSPLSKKKTILFFRLSPMRKQIEFKSPQQSPTYRLIAEA